jgi:hypothetical protein
MLEQALDYPGQARLVAFCWSPLGDEAIYHDGQCSGEADWAAYVTFVEHPKVKSHLRPYDLGSSEEEARDFLVLDREARTLSVLPAEEAAALLQQQWGTRPALPLRLEALDPIPHVLAAVTGKAGWRVVWLDGAPVAQRRRQQEARLDELRTWLDRQEAQESPPASAF